VRSARPVSADLRPTSRWPVLVAGSVFFAECTVRSALPSRLITQRLSPPRGEGARDDVAVRILREATPTRGPSWLAPASVTIGIPSRSFSCVAWTGNSHNPRRTSAPHLVVVRPRETVCWRSWRSSLLTWQFAPGRLAPSPCCGNSGFSHRVSSRLLFLAIGALGRHRRGLDLAGTNLLHAFWCGCRSCTVRFRSKG
jgi:hypothetical protein